MALWLWEYGVSGPEGVYHGFVLNGFILFMSEGAHGFHLDDFAMFSHKALSIRHATASIH